MHESRAEGLLMQTLNALRTRTIALVSVAALTFNTAAAQTVITEPDNKYSVAQDVELGREAATEVERQLPILRDDQVTGAMESIGRRLVDSIPDEFRHSEFRYTFKVVNAREINAFALPGGPLYLNR